MKADTQSVTDKIPLGCVVRSNKGRDSGRYSVIVKVNAGRTDRAEILIADGLWHKISAPKRKNPAHVSLVENVSPETERQLAELAQNGTLTDKKLRSLLARLFC